MQWGRNEIVVAGLQQDSMPISVEIKFTCDLTNAIPQLLCQLKGEILNN